MSKLIISSISIISVLVIAFLIGFKKTLEAIKTIMEEKK